MSHQNVMPAGPNGCAICGNQKRKAETWFSITENAWEDRLHIWRWNAELCVDVKVHLLCSPRHVRELIKHWMAAGSLQYPFAASQAPRARKSLAPRQSPALLAPTAKHLGEIAVDRGGITRALRDNPLSLNTLLDELMIVLENEVAGSENQESKDEYCFALSRV